MASVSPKLMIQKEMASSYVSLKFSPRGTLAALVPFQGSITVIDRQGRTLYRPVPPAENCRDLSWSADGQALYCSRGNRFVELVGLDGTIISTWEADSRVDCFHVSPDGSMIALATMERLQCLDGEGNLLWERTLTEGGILKVGILPSGNVLAIFYGTLIREYDRTGTVVMDYSAGGESPLTMTLRGDSALLPCQTGVYRLTAGIPEARRIIDSANTQCVALGTEGGQMAAGLADGTILITDADGTVTVTLAPESDCIQQLDWSPDGSLLLTGSFDGVIRTVTPRGETVWRSTAGLVGLAGFSCEKDKGLTLFRKREEMLDHFGVKQEIRDFIIKQTGLFAMGSIVSLHAGPGGALAMSFDQTVSLWDRKGKQLWCTPSLGVIPNAVRFSPGGDVIAAGCSDGTIRLYDAKGGMSSSFSTGSAAIIRTAWNPEIDAIATSYSYESLHIDLWDRKGNHLRRIEGNGDCINDLAFFPDGRLASAAMNGTVRIWSPEGNLLEDFLDPDGFSIKSLCIADNGAIMALDTGGNVIIWKQGGRRKILKPKSTDMMVHSILPLEIGTYVTSYTQQMANTVAVRTVNGELIFKRTMEGNAVDIPMAHDAATGTIYCGVNNMLYRFDRDGNALDTIRAGKARIFSLDFRPGASITIVAGYADGMIDIIDGEGNVATAELDRVQEISAVSIDPRGDRFAAAAGEGTIHLWDREFRETACFSTGHQVPSLRISPGGDYIAAGSTEGILEIWTVQGELVADREGEPYNAPICTVWKEDGEALAVAYASGKVVQMDLRCSPLIEFNDMFCFQPAISYDATGRLLLYVNMDMDLAVRDADSGELLCLVTPFAEGMVVSTPDDYFDVTDDALLPRVLFRRDGELVSADQVPGRRVKGLLEKVLS